MIRPNFAFFLLLVSLSSTMVMADDYMPRIEMPTPTVEWQKVTLEEKILEKIDRAIAPIVPARHYVVNVNITLKAKVIAKKLPRSERAPADEGVGTIGLSKLELDAPLMEALNVRPPEKEEVESVFDRIQTVAVSVLLDTSISDSKATVVERVARDVADSVAKNGVQVKIERAEIFSPIDPPKREPASDEKKLDPKNEKDAANSTATPAEEPWTLKKWLIEFKLPIGFLMGIVLICAWLAGVIGLIFRGYRAIEARRLTLLETQAANAANAAPAREERSSYSAPTPQSEATQQTQTAQLAVPARGAGSALAAHESSGQTGFQKFQAYLAQSPEAAAGLIKQWSRSPGGDAEAALAALPQFLTTEEFLSIFPFLTAEDRKRWKRALALPVDATVIQRGETFASAQLMDSLLMPMPTIDAAARVALLELTSSECVTLAGENIEAGALLMGLLPTEQVSRMYALMPQDLASAVTAATLKLSEDELRARAGTLIPLIGKIKAANRVATSPFLEKAEELLREATAEKESLIFSSLAEVGDFESLNQIAQRNFPAELVMKLPAAMIKAVLERMSVARRVELVASSDETEANLLLDTLGKAGSKMRDMMGVELGEIQNDAGRLARVRKNRDLLKREFLNAARGLIRTNPSAGESAEQILAAWLAEKSGGRVGESGMQGGQRGQRVA